MRQALLVAFLATINFSRNVLTLLTKLCRLVPAFGLPQGPIQTVALLCIRKIEVASHISTTDAMAVGFGLLFNELHG